MTPEQLKTLTRESFERLFNDGDLDYADSSLAAGAVDHQEPAGTDFAAHLKHVITTLRTAFPDLHFAVEPSQTSSSTAKWRSGKAVRSVVMTCLRCAAKSVPAGSWWSTAPAASDESA